MVETSRHKSVSGGVSSDSRTSLSTTSVARMTHHLTKIKTVADSRSAADTKRLHLRSIEERRHGVVKRQSDSFEHLVAVSIDEIGAAVEETVKARRLEAPAMSSASSKSCSVGSAASRCHRHPAARALHHRTETFTFVAERVDRPLSVSMSTSHISAVSAVT
jgi:hypothetical protein